MLMSEWRPPTLLRYLPRTADTLSLPNRHILSCAYFILRLCDVLISDLVTVMMHAHLPVPYIPPSSNGTLLYNRPSFVFIESSIDPARLSDYGTQDG